MVPTKATQELLESKGFKNVKVWTRGVNHKLFNPKYRKPWGQGYILCVSRASKEKNIDEFCQLHYPNKVFVGDGLYIPTLALRASIFKIDSSISGFPLLTFKSIF